MILSYCINWDRGLWPLVGGSDLSSPAVWEPHLTPDHGVVASHGSAKVVLDQGVVRLLDLDLPCTRTPSNFLYFLLINNVSYSYLSCTEWRPP